MRKPKDRPRNLNTKITIVEDDEMAKEMEPNAVIQLLGEFSAAHLRRRSPSPSHKRRFRKLKLWQETRQSRSLTMRRGAQKYSDRGISVGRRTS